MNYGVGKYYIAKKGYWTAESCNVIFITEIDHSAREVIYFYDDQEDKIRVRDFFEFQDVVLVPMSSLLEELI